MCPLCVCRHVLVSLAVVEKHMLVGLHGESVGGGGGGGHEGRGMEENMKTLQVAVKCKDNRLTGTGVPSVSSLSSCLKHSTLL